MIMVLLNIFFNNIHVNSDTGYTGEVKTPLENRMV